MDVLRSCAERILQEHGVDPKHTTSLHPCEKQTFQLNQNVY